MLIALLFAAAAPQTTPPGPPPSPPVDCGDADHRALDFWLGKWNVYVTGTTSWVANSRIEKIVGCAISETYDQFVNRAGKKIDYHGRPISSYVPADKDWQQYYVDSSGAAATLKGGIEDDAMIFLSRLGPLTNRMTVSRNPDGSVRQRGDFSSDDGKTWASAYDFTYVKAPEAIAGVVNIITRRTITGIPTRKVSAKRKRK